ncbi:hypothetical protein EDD21DRAFT_311082 [Dissophora ornata]|nr:hypothetical protein EDD21DRAFT_311082 [Dissophora ornata]
MSVVGRRSWWTELGRGHVSVPISVYNIHKAYTKTPTDPEAIGAWEKIMESHDISKYLKDGKVVSSTEDIDGEHEYLVTRYVPVENPHEVIGSVYLSLLYLLSITGYRGLILKDEPLFKEFEKPNLTDGEYLKLVERCEAEGVFERGLEECFRRAKNGEGPPIGSRVLLFTDSVEIVQHIMEGNIQGLILKTMNKHTFKIGYSMHMFEHIPGLKDQLRFFNQGEGTTAVPFFGYINNRIAILMWAASSVMGALRLRQFFLKDIQTFQEFLKFLKDKDGTFREHVQKHADPQLLEIITLLSLMSETFGGLNLDLVTAFTFAEELNQADFEALIDQLNLVHQSDFEPKWLLNIDDKKCEELKLDEMAKEGRMLRTMFLAGITDHGTGPMPPDMKDVLPGLYGPHGLRYGDSIIGESKLDPGTWNPDLAKRLEQVFQEKIATYLTQSVIKDIREKVLEKAKDALQYVKIEDTNPSEFTDDIIGRGYLNETLASVLDPILELAKLATLNTIFTEATNAKAIESFLPLDTFKEQVTARVMDVYIRDICSVFVGKDQLLDIWTNSVVEEAFMGPKREQQLEKQYEQALAQKVESELALDNFRKVNEATRDKETIELKEARLDLEERVKENEAKAERYKEGLKKIKEVKKEEPQKKREKLERDFIGRFKK